MSFPRQALCPCCRFPTLNENGCCEICVICWWEDDGQCDDDADENRRGPNFYSLTAARKNFANHGHMYDRGRGIERVEAPSAARRELLEYLQSLGFDPQRVDMKRLGKLMDAEDRQIGGK